MALAIGLPFVFAAIGYGGLGFVSLVAHDHFRVPARSVPGTHKVTIGVGSGDVSVSPSHDGRSQFSGVVYYSLFRPKLHWRATPAGVVHLSGGPICLGWAWDCGANLQLSIPPGRYVQASSGSGNVRAHDLSGSVKLSSGSGDVVAKTLSGPLTLYAGSGNITATGLSSPTVRASDGSGDVKLAFTKPPTQVRVGDSSGNITIALPANVAYYVVAHASSGSTNISVPQDPKSHRVVRLSDGSGNIKVVPS